MRIRPEVLVSLGCTLTLAGVQPAHAQNADAVEAVAEVEEVLVTGSRIMRQGYVSESPIVSVAPEVITSQGAVTLEATMNQLPQLVPSAGPSANLSPRGGQASANLRGLGSQRTLVLLDGRRMQPANGDGSVDLNLIPTSIVGGVEVVTGGASAVYGSDAVTGVVNFMLRRDIEGVELSAQVGATEQGDGETQEYSLLIGGDFDDDRGSSFVALSYSRREPVLSADRLYFGSTGSSASLPSGNMNVNATNLPMQSAVNAVFGGYGLAPGAVSRSARLYFNTDGTLFTQSGAAGPLNYRDGYTGLASSILRVNNSLLYNAAPFSYVQIPLHRLNVFSKTEYELTDSIKLFGQVLYSDYTVTANRLPNVQGSASSYIPLTVPVTNPFISADFATLLASRPDPGAAFTITKRSAENQTIYQEFKYNVYEVVVGLSGVLPHRGWTWEVEAAAGRTKQVESQIDYASNIALNNLLSAADGGASICEGGYNPFGLHPLSEECQNYVNRKTHSLTYIDVRSADANLAGDLFQVPAGAVAFAAGVSYREVEYLYEPDALISTGELAGYLPIKGTQGTTQVAEVYGEVLVPVLRDLPLANELNVHLAYRYSDHKSIGGVSTYKVDLDWRPVEMLRLRGGYARAIRAPSAGELFAPQNFSTTSFGTPGPAGSGDPCDTRSAYRAVGAPNALQVRALCLSLGMPTAVVDTYQNLETGNTTVAGGNPNLEAEIADTFSVGAVLRSPLDHPLLSSAMASIDYYSIALDGAVGVVTSPLLAQRCFNADGSNPSFDPANYYCTLMTRRETDGGIALLQNPLFNLGGYETSGLDFNADWRFALADTGWRSAPGRLSFSTNVNYLESFKIKTLANAPFVDYAGTLGNGQIDPYATARPRWKAMSSVRYAVGPIELGLNWRYLGKMEPSSNVATNGDAPDIEAVSYFDVNGQYEVNEKVTLSFGIINLADREPPVVSVDANGQRSTDPGTYDVIGRRFFAKAKVKF